VFFNAVSAERRELLTDDNNRFYRATSEDLLPPLSKS
jgi:hypothetical protein